MIKHPRMFGARDRLALLGSAEGRIRDAIELVWRSQQENGLGDPLSRTQAELERLAERALQGFRQDLQSLEGEAPNLPL